MARLHSLKTFTRYQFRFPNGVEGEFRAYNTSAADAVAYVYQKDRRWYVAGIDPVGAPRNGPFKDLETVPAYLSERCAA